MQCSITGGAGFIGRHLVHTLLAETDCFVRVIDDASRLGPLQLQHPRLETVHADISDLPALRRAMHGSEVVFHLAATATVMGCEQNPDRAHETNVTGTFNVLRTAAERSVRRVVFASSREVYGEVDSQPVSESASLKPKNVYGGTKAAGEMYCSWASSMLEVSVLRLANVVGPGDVGRVFPRFVAAARTNQPLLVYGGDQVLDFVGVDAVVQAFMRVAFGRYLPAPINVGTGKGTSILNAAKRVIEAFSSTSELQILPSRGADTSNFVAATDRMVHQLGIVPGDPLRDLGCLEDQSTAGASQLTGAHVAAES